MFKKYIFLLILPVCLYITADTLKEVQGPYYLNFYDPSYVYLISSLNLAQGERVGHFDHPGTTVQTTGALIVKIYHLLSNPDTDIVSDVLTRPEDYLRTMNRIFIVINSFVLFLFGIFVFRISGNLLLSMLLQLSPFVSMENFYGLIITTPENFLVFVTLCFLSILIFYLYKIDPDNIPFSIIIYFAVVSGFGLATKLNFLPLLLIPLILLKGFKNKIMFCAFTVITFLIFVFPALSNYERFFIWVERLFLFSGHYGTGSENVIDSSSFVSSLKLIFFKDNIFTAAYLILLFTVTILFFRKPKPGSENKSFIKEKNILVSVFLSITLQIIMVAKHYAQYYMIPSFVLCIFVIVLSSILLSQYISLFSRFSLNSIYIFIFTIISVWSLVWIIISYNEGSKQRTEAFRIEKYIEDNYKDDLVISSYGSADRDCALAFASEYGATQTERYNMLLSKLTGQHIFYNPWINAVHDIDKNDNIIYSLCSRKKIILQINNYGSPDRFTETLNNICGIRNSTYKKVFSNGNDESVYEVYLSSH